MSDPSVSVTCEIHGKSHATYICQHLVTGSNLGFYYGDETDPRPDAWCGDCDHVLITNSGEWNDASEANAGVTLVCAGCYDQVRRRNEVLHKRIRPAHRPTLEEDGWELDSAVKQHRLHPETFLIPTENDLRQLRTGDIAKLLFLFVGSNNQIECERMWVAITQVNDNVYAGTLQSKPAAAKVLQSHTEVEFTREHIASILHPSYDQQPLREMFGLARFKSSSWKDNDAYY